MIRLPYATLLVASIVTALVSVSGCKRSTNSTNSGDAHPGAAVSKQAAPHSTPAASDSVVSDERSRGRKLVAKAVPSAAPAMSVRVVASDSEIDLGPSSYAEPCRVGLVSRVSGADKLVLSKWNDGKPTPLRWGDAKPSRSHVSVADGTSPRVYWVRQGHLVRQVIEPDGKMGKQDKLVWGLLPVPVSAAHATAPVERDLILGAKVGGAKGDRRVPVLWVEGQPDVVPLSREVQGVVSLDLVHLGGGRFAALFVDGHLGMSPVHAVYVELDENGKPSIGKDQVVYVAGPAETKMRVTGIQVGMGPIGLLPNFRDTLHFGLLTMRIGYGKGPEAQTWWLDYPRGLDPAPVAVVRACGVTGVIFAFPSAKQPQSDEQVLWAELKSDGTLGPRRQLARASRVVHLGVRVDSKGMWLMYATAKKLLGKRISCGELNVP